MFSVAWVPTFLRHRRHQQLLHPIQVSPPWHPTCSKHPRESRSVNWLAQTRSFERKLHLEGPQPSLRFLLCVLLPVLSEGLRPNVSVSFRVKNVSSTSFSTNKTQQFFLFCFQPIFPPPLKKILSTTPNHFPHFHFWISLSLEKSKQSKSESLVGDLRSFFQLVKQIFDGPKEKLFEQ